jgi:hypothetical protein
MTKAGALFLTDAQVAERIGLTTEAFKEIVPELMRQGFPEPDPLFCNRRYWPACKDFLDNRCRVAPSSFPDNSVHIGDEPW